AGLGPGGLRADHRQRGCRRLLVRSAGLAAHACRPAAAARSDAPLRHRPLIRLRDDIKAPTAAEYSTAARPGAADSPAPAPRSRTSRGAAAPPPGRAAAVAAAPPARVPGLAGRP